MCGSLLLYICAVHWIFYLISIPIMYSCHLFLFWFIILTSSQLVLYDVHLLVQGPVAAVIDAVVAVGKVVVVGKAHLPQA